MPNLDLNIFGISHIPNNTINAGNELKAILA
jgi:hypothetical protein